MNACVFVLETFLTLMCSIKRFLRQWGFSFLGLIHNLKTLFYKRNKKNNFVTVLLSSFKGTQEVWENTREAIEKHSTSSCFTRISRVLHASLVFLTFFVPTEIAFSSSFDFLKRFRRYLVLSYFALYIALSHLDISNFLLVVNFIL